MFENLLNLVKEHAGDAIINNAAIPNEHNDAAIETTTNGIIDGLKSHLGSNGIEGLTSMFQGGNQSGMVQSISQNVAGSLMQKFGIDNNAANGIVQSLIPVVMNKFVNKTNDPNDSSFDIQGIIGSLAGGNNAGIGDMLGKIFG
ncbi:MAG: hypothetical protein RJA07_606 [Bacteroidota bacterium]|jgi:hypothetical protein